MAIKWNDDQLHAMNDQGRSILVSAAAGSGKTAVLSNRILNRLKDQDHPVDVDEFLVLTYTRAAAAEMKERIHKLISEEIEHQPENEHLRRQLSLINNAQISTIDSFCTQVLRNYFHLINLDPAFRIGEEAELLLLEEEALAEILEEKYTEKDERFLHFMEAYAPNKKELPVEKMIKDLYKFSQSHPYPEQYLKQCADNFNITDKEKLSKQEWMKFVDAITKSYIEGALEELQEAIVLASDPCGPNKYLENLNAEYDAILKIKDEKDYFERVQRFEQVEFHNLPRITKKDEVDEGLKERVKALREDVKKKIKEKIKDYAISAEEEVAALKVCKEYADELIHLTMQYAKRFFEKKQEKNILDFSDVEHLALKVLRNEQGHHEITDAARELSQNYVEIMVDEYQDSNYVQEAILTAIARTDEQGIAVNMFMVGDIKQSIYRFRMARPELFAEKYSRFTLEESKEQKILLKQNYRSRDEVVDTTNCIFEAIMHADLGKVEYDKSARLVRGSQFVLPEHEKDFKSEILLVDPNEQEGNIKEEDSRLEARMIATRIQQMVGTLKITDADTKELRPAKYRDIVLLSRSLRNSTEIIEELEDYGIPVKCVQKQGLLDSREVRLILNLLSVIDNRRQDIALASVLYSPIVGLSEQELAMIRIADQEETFYEAVFAYAKEGEDENLREKLKSFLQLLDEYTRKCEYLSLRELIEEIYSSTGYLNYAAMLPAGEQRKANLLLLVEKAAAYEKEGYKSLYRFIHYLSELKKNKVNIDEADLGEIEEDVVTLMTIHKSKGLEFPIVFVCNMGRKINTQDEKGSLLMHADYGIGMNMIDVERRVKADTLMKKALADAVHNDNHGEEMRVLYVALTRAKDKLVMTGVYKKCEEMLEHQQYNATPSYYSRYKAACYLDWVIPVLNGKDHLVDITVYDPNRLESRSRVVEKRGNVLRIINKPFDEKVKEEIERRLLWKYPYEKEMVLPTKVSVSELKHLDIEKAVEENEQPPRMEYAQEISKRQEYYVPSFIKETQEAPEGALYGTAVHRFMELFDFTSEYADGDEHDENWKRQRSRYLEQCKEEFVKSGRMLQEDADRLILSRLESFFDSEACARMHKAAQKGLLFKEKPFVMGIEAGEVESFPNIGHVDSKELVLMQGIIDVYWEEEDYVVLLDYKTDYVESKEDLIKKYFGQLDNYKKALERTLAKPVKEKILYSFCLEKEISLDEA
ncbi:helicase-exonuclease AddAB subunit AddA [Eubacterium oxidoreducens]|uniref:ATP-dependent helicase/nuclease subunit A n=1 Tax=Eubacterium oxidoreducens TaxID=1732 RepID=A0A1G6BM98_EUBOX|nr:helicase-exonuclease AddAB subunit AddA [Eubacterium oxidoreducens]SDB21729.1 DNA helicase/exodeoxyribonuclease V, subunit A [Eubacterium oxidoreducens]